MVKTTTLYNLTNNEKLKLIDKLTSILEKDDRILFAYLHGSFNDENAFRDIDIAVYLQPMTPGEMLKLELHLEEILESAVKYPVDLKVLNNAPSHFSYMVIKKGKKLLVSDDSRRVSFEMLTYKKYFDFEPFRRRYLKEA